jgi:hypothetical protein
MDITEQNPSTIMEVFPDFFSVCLIFWSSAGAHMVSVFFPISSVLFLFVKSVVYKIL